MAKQQLYRRFFFRVLVLVTFVVVAGLALFYAFGFQYDRESSKVIETGILRLTQRLSDVRVLLNDELVADSLPLDMSYVVPGHYKLDVQKEGFYPWSVGVDVVAGKIKVVDKILLIPKEISSRQKLVAKASDEVMMKYFVGSDFLGQVDEKDLLTLFHLNVDGELVVTGYDLGTVSGANFFPLSSGRILIQKMDGTLKFLSPGRFESNSDFKISDNVENFRVFGSRAYYLRFGRLFSFDLPSPFFGDSTQEIIGEKIFDGLKTFEVLDLDKGLFLFEYESGLRAFGFLNEETGAFRIVDSGIQGVPVLSPDGNLLLYRKNDEFWIFDIEAKQSTFLTRFSDQVRELKWYIDSWHLLFIESDRLKICDLAFSNCSVLTPVDPTSKIDLLLGIGKMIFRKDGNFYALDLSFD